MTRIYISGPVTGIRSRNIDAFWDAESRLNRVGYYASIPHQFVRAVAGHEEAMRCSIHKLTATSLCEPLFDGVALLPGWEQSEGARLEKAVADACGIPCKTVDEWIEEAR